MQELEEYDNMVENQANQQKQYENTHEEEIVLKEGDQNYEENNENDTFVQKEDLLNEAVVSVSEKDLRDISLNESFKKRFSLNISELNNSNEEVHEMKKNNICKYLIDFSIRLWTK